MSKKDAIKEVAKIRKLNKNLVYEEYHKSKRVMFHVKHYPFAEDLIFLVNNYKYKKKKR